jgi:prolyl-tRNA synthetase
MLTEFQARLFGRALRMREGYTVQVVEREELLAAFEGSRNSLAHGPWCGGEDCEAEVKDATRGATIRVITEEPTAGACAACGRPATSMVYWARAY